MKTSYRIKTRFNKARMIYFSNAKINIGLQVTGRRPDGYHNIETVFYPVDLSDILEITPLHDKPGDYTFLNTGNKIDMEPSDNLCIRAWRELSKIRHLPGASIHLHKVIPSGAGLGGGSSNATYVLRALNELFELEIDTNELEVLASRIGSDCPFFIHNRPLLAKGRGNVFELVDIDLSGTHILIVHPGIPVSSAWAYNGINIKEHHESLKKIIGSDPVDWQDNIFNDFEDRVFEVYPAIRLIKEKMLAQGAFYSSMTGSGSAVYGLYEKEPDTDWFKKEYHEMFVWGGVL